MLIAKLRGSAAIHFFKTFSCGANTWIIIGRTISILYLYWTNKDATWYGWSLGAIVYFCVLVTLTDQGHSIKFKGKFLKLSEWSENSSERFRRRKYAKFCTWPSPNYSRSHLRSVKMAYKWGYKLISHPNYITWMTEIFKTFILIHEGKII